MTINAAELLQPGNVDEQRRTYQCRLFLRVFWQKAKKAADKKKRLALLRVFAGLVLGADPYVKHNQRWARFHFEKRKKSGAFYLGGSCWICGLRAQCRHHVIQVQHGGRNTVANIVKLCNLCHRAVHGGDKAADEWPQIDFAAELSKAKDKEFGR